MKRIKVTPRKGLTIRHPVTRAAIPPEGMEVDDDTFWRRRERSEDVVVTEVAAPASPDLSPSGAPELGPADMVPVTPLTTRDEPPGVPATRRGRTPGDDR